jgi:chromosome segregation ATPase
MTDFDRQSEKEEELQRMSDRITLLEASLVTKEGALRGEKRKAETLELELLRQAKIFESLQGELLHKNSLIARIQREGSALKANLREILELFQDGNLSVTEQSFDFGHCDLTSIGLEGVEGAGEGADDQSVISAVDFGEFDSCSHESSSVIHHVKLEICSIRQKLLSNQHSYESNLQQARAENGRLRQECHRLKLSLNETAQSLGDEVDELRSELHAAQQRELVSQSEVRELMDSLFASEQRVEALMNDLQRAVGRETDLLNELAARGEEVKKIDVIPSEV